MDDEEGGGYGFVNCGVGTADDDADDVAGGVILLGVGGCESAPACATIKPN